VRDPNTLLALRDARDAVQVLRPLVNYVAPYQTVCNYTVYYLTGLQGDVAFTTANGSAQAVLLKSDTNSPQDNKLGSMGDRQADIPANVDPHGATYPGSNAPWEVAHTQTYEPAIDAQGNADCQRGQEGYPTGPLNGPIGRGQYDPTYRPHSVPNPADPNAVQAFDAGHAGGSHTVNQMNDPGLLGPTFKGVKQLRDVP
jgi:hypothetical protein